MGKTIRMQRHKERDRSPKDAKDEWLLRQSPPLADIQKKLKKKEKENRKGSVRQTKSKVTNAKDEQYKMLPLGSVSLSNKMYKEIETILNLIEVTCFFVGDDGSYKHLKNANFVRDFLQLRTETIDDNLRKTVKKPPVNTQLNKKYQKEHSSKLNNIRYTAMLEQRKKLPAFNMKEEILEIVSENDIVVISGETGCGKTTQVAQFILDDFLEKGKGSECRVLCTQPRRISAISVAQRVADERAESLGISVGYQIRLERRLPRDRASICFCTTGVVLKFMESDPALSSVSHLILDEIHERDVMSDFILALIKKIKKRRKDLKVILMSATLNADKFSKYYDNAPHVNIPGFTFPVQEFYLEDVLLRTGFEFGEKQTSVKKLTEFSKFVESHVRFLKQNKQYNQKVYKQLRNPLSETVNVHLIFSLLVNICQKEKDQGAILVFLRCFSEIFRLSKMITSSELFPQEKFLIFFLHSETPTFKLKQVFENPPEGKRKIILATNIAETSITIDDVVYVIDCGKINLADFKVETNSDVLTTEWVSLANANQRRGRAGRVKPGFCFHLFSKARKVLLKETHPPEISRRRLEDVILTAKAIRLGKVATFFAQMMDPPDKKAVTLSLNLLEQMNILASDKNLTPLGYHLAKLPMSPQLAKMILFGAIFSCLDPVLSVAATLDYKDPFNFPIGEEGQVRDVKLQLSDSDSDHLLYHEVLQGFEKSNNPKEYCQLHFLSYHTLLQLLEIKKQFMQCLHDLNLVTSVYSNNPDCNTNSDNVNLVKAIICAGLYPNVAVLKQLGTHHTWTPDFYKLDIHQKSLLANRVAFAKNNLIYYRKLFSNGDFIHDCSLVDPLPILFFGHKFRQIGDTTKVSINGTMHFLCEERLLSVIKTLRNYFNVFLEYKIAHPGPVLWPKIETKILQAIVELITHTETE